MLADEGLIDPQRIGAIGGSYGGGMSMALGALRTARCCPTAASSPGRARAASRCGSPRRGAGHHVDRPRLLADARTAARSTTSPTRPTAGARRRKEAVLRQQRSTARAWMHRASTRRSGTDPTADMIGWRTRHQAGEPYGGRRRSGDDRRAHPHHSSYYIDHCVATGADADGERLHRRPLPGRRDDPLLQPHQDSVPGRRPALFLGDFGHMRAQNKSDVTAALTAAENAWMDHYVKGVGAAAAAGRDRVHDDVPERRSLGRPLHGSRLGADRQGRDAPRRRGAKTIDPDRRQRVDRGGVQPDRRRRSLRAGSGRRPARARPRIDSIRRPPAATRCWARRR